MLWDTILSKHCWITKYMADSCPGALFYLRSVLYTLVKKMTSFVFVRKCLLSEGLCGLSWFLQAQEALGFSDFFSLAETIHLHNLYNGRRNSVS